MKNQQLQKKLFKLIAEEFDIPVEDLSLKTRLDEIGIDTDNAALDEILMDFEDREGVQVDPVGLHQAETLGELLSLFDEPEGDMQEA